ncbi:DNA polymerase I [Eubacteriales bacterium OttesenSCG-928-N13]|nr:DNA polymerase I [Eubacteriales bacterium OttesenSCG-928-N13]
MPEKLILVDGHSLMYRAFHALPLLDNGEGVFTNAIYGFFNMLFSAIGSEQPDYLGVAFDLSEPTFRHLQYDQYKAGRAPTPDELRPQFALIKQMLTAMHVPLLSISGFEADDVLGTLSKQAEQKGIQALLITGDRDAFQLAGEYTTILYTKRGITEIERVTPAFVMDQYGVTPHQLIDMKGLMGDKSDNIPGVPGVGEKTASKLIAQYGTLERALDTAETDQKGALRERLIHNKEQAVLSKWLATIDRDAPIELDIPALRLGGLEGARPLFEQYKLKTLLTRLDQLSGMIDAGPNMEQTAATQWQELRILETAEQLAAWTLDAKPSKLALHFGAQVSIATDAGEQLMLPLGGDLLTPGASEEDAAMALSPLLSSDCMKVLHSIKSIDLPMEGEKWDLTLGAYVLDAQRKSYQLEALLLDEPAYRADAPAAAMIDLCLHQNEQMEQDELTGLYQDMELPLSYVLRSMEQIGFLVDEAELARLGSIYEARIAQLTESIYQHAGRQININSPKQLGELLYDQMGLQGGKKTKTGYSTNADALEQIADQHPIIPEILEYRKYAKLKSTYIDALIRLRAQDGRIHTSFDQTATATGRISSLEPNLQNIPVRTELGREIRGAFIAREGHILVDADYSQIELRVLAHMSGDPVMTEAFLLGQDIHQRTAAEVYGVPLDQVTKQMRSNAKAVNFGIVYGISDFGLARNIGVSRAEAKSFIERYFARYPGIKQFMDECVAEGKLNGFVKTMFGRRRYLPELKSPNYNIRSFGERAAMNSPIQGTAADIIKLAMVRVYDVLAREFPNSRLILQVHDELIIEAPMDEAQDVQQLLQREMEQVIELHVPLKADVSQGRNWNECK